MYDSEMHVALADVYVEVPTHLCAGRKIRTQSASYLLPLWMPANLLAVPVQPFLLKEIKRFIPRSTTMCQLYNLRCAPLTMLGFHISRTVAGNVLQPKIRDRRSCSWTPERILRDLS